MSADPGLSLIVVRIKGRECSREGLLVRSEFFAGMSAWNVRLDGLPTLVLHGTADPMFSLAHGRALASAIPGAQQIELDDVGPPTRALCPVRYQTAALVGRNAPVW